MGVEDFVGSTQAPKEELIDGTMGSKSQEPSAEDCQGEERRMKIAAEKLQGEN